jgi:hypothetical protein
MVTFIFFVLKTANTTVILFVVSMERSDAMCLHMMCCKYSEMTHREKTKRQHGYIFIVFFHFYLIFC